jgi:hypothetical protein
MVKSLTIFIALFAIYGNCFSQKFSIGDELTPKLSAFRLVGISSETQVHTYKYIGKITDTYFFDRKIGDIIVGIKNGIVVTTIYNLIPEKDDIGVPMSTLELIQKGLPFPLAYRDGVWGVNIDKESFSLSRAKNVLTFNKDRIMFMSTIKQKYLNQ